MTTFQWPALKRAFAELSVASADVRAVRLAEIAQDQPTLASELVELLRASDLTDTSLTLAVSDTAKDRQ